MRKYEEPTEVIEKVGRTSYRLQLPTWIRIHPVMHVSNLKPYCPDDDDYQCNQVTRPPVTMKDSSKKEVKEILVERTRRIGNPKRNLQEFLVKWKGLPEAKISWERADYLKTAALQIAEFEEMRRLTGMPTNWGRMSWSCLSKACCPWSHARYTSKPLPCTTLSLSFTAFMLYYILLVFSKSMTFQRKSWLHLVDMKCLKMYYRGMRLVVKLSLPEKLYIV